MLKLDMPDGAKRIIQTLESTGYEAYIVGGCVRDSLLGVAPHDWDICTSAIPSEVKSCFNEFNIIETGIKHGTVTVVLNGESYEVTTFRVEEMYTDFRHPDKVTFVKSLSSDLSRRDFTMNAMAYNEKTGLIDPFGGAFDIMREEISCVGNAGKRFQEDPLRILRALRFASVFGYSISERTRTAILECKSLLGNISAERVRDELCKLLMGKCACQVLIEFNEIISKIIPEIEPCVGFQQNNPYHMYTVYDHMVHSVEYYQGNDLSVKVALFMHDIGKPLCYTEDERGGHFYGHGAYCYDVAKQVLKRLKFDNKTSSEVLTLILYHDSIIEPTAKAIRRWLNKIGPERLKQLLEVREADIRAQATGSQEDRLEKCAAVRQEVDRTIESDECFSLKDLCVNGYDIMKMGVPEGRVVGQVLNDLLNEVMENMIENERFTLLERAKELI